MDRVDMLIFCHKPPFMAFWPRLSLLIIYIILLLADYHGYRLYSKLVDSHRQDLDSRRRPLGAEAATPFSSSVGNLPQYALSYLTRPILLQENL